MDCGAFDPASGYVTGLTAFVDCRSEQLAQDGYMALAATGSPVQLALGGFVTILVALFGYRLLLGDRLDIRDGLLAIVRLGVVLALSTQWPAYQTLVYGVVIEGPAELTTSILASSGDLPGPIPGRIETSYRALEALAHPRPAATVAAPPPTGSGAAAPQALRAAPLAGLTIDEQKRLSSSATALLVSSLGALLCVRVAAALLLALGPLFALCLLFDGLRGWFEGWIRGLAGAAFGSIAASTVLALELSVLEPQLAELANGLPSRLVRPGATTEVFATCLLFGIVLAAVMLLVVRAAAGFRLPFWMRPLPATADAGSGLSAAPWSERVVQRERSGEQAGRAQQIADTVRLIDHRSTAGHEVRSAATTRLAIAGPGGEVSAGTVVALGRTYRRTQALARVSATGRRNQRA